MSTNKLPFSPLPVHVVPRQYKLKIKPDLEAFTFKGSETIQVEVLESTKAIELNCLDIDVTDVTYTVDGETTLKGEVLYNKECETATFSFPEVLQSGAGTLAFSFTGELNEKMKGFYRSVYKDTEGNSKYEAVTQFEATDARRAFPCWDEPKIKATFEVTLVGENHKTILSNMPEVSRDDEAGGYVAVNFAETPVMSTYLLAFIVGEYDYVEGKDERGTLVRVYTPLGKKHQGTFALDVATKTLSFYEKYFNIEYPLPKVDLIAIADFAAGAMENWGLITYRETALLIDPVESSNSMKQWVALVVGHELAHQWFGNLVTMQWWTDLWLNEGFASWIEYLCVSMCFPQFDIWTQFLSQDFARALELDALANSHPIEVEVGHPSEIDEIFDSISYCKGASVIRMLQNHLGETVFCKGLTNYLNEYKYKNACTQDLWAELSQASDIDVNELMKSWTQRMGFPVLKVTQKIEGTTRQIKVQQEKFCAGMSNTENSEPWHVPISIIAGAGQYETEPYKVVMTEKDCAITLNEVPEDTWIKFNAGSIGFYRTLYSPDMIEALKSSIHNMTPHDRFGLENDAFALARAGEASTVDALRLAESFDKETNFTVWSDLTSKLVEVAVLLRGSGVAAKNLSAFIHRLYAGVYERLGFDPIEDESPLDSMLRGLVINILGSHGYQPVIDKAKQAFKDHCDGTAQINSELRLGIYRTVLKHGDDTELEECLTLFKAEQNQEEKVRLLKSIGAIQQIHLIKKVIAFVFTDEVRPQDRCFAFGGCTHSVDGLQQAWDYFKDNHAKLVATYGAGFLINRFISPFENFITDAKANEVKTFFAANPIESTTRTVQQTIENIKLNARQLERDSKKLETFLATAGK